MYYFTSAPLSCISCLLIPEPLQTLPHLPSHTQRENCKRIVLFSHMIFFYLLTRQTISVYKYTLPLISPGLAFSFPTLQRFCVTYYFLQSKGAESFPLKWFQIKAIHTCLLIFVSNSLSSYTAISVFLDWGISVCFMVMHWKVNRRTDLEYK